MKSYERRSIITFMLLYLGGIILMSSLVFWWYYHKEVRRINSERIVALKLYDVQCKRLLRNAPKDFECTIQKPDFNDVTTILFREIAIAAILTTLFGALLSFYLALISLRPMRDAVDIMDNFVESMIHDLNTPISSARLNADALLKQELNSSQNRRVNRILGSLQMMQDLEAKLRSTIQHAKISYEDKELSLCSLCEKYKEQSSFITLKCQNPIIIFADKLMIERMVDNLISNAIKYNRNNNPIEILIEKNRLSITDHGTGIKYPKQIFEPHYRESNIISGLGLGLGIVKNVCDHYNIDILVKSKLHLGTTVTLDFSSFVTQDV